MALLPLGTAATQEPGVWLAKYAQLTKGKLIYLVPAATAQSLPANCTIKRRYEASQRQAATSGR